MTSYFCIPIPYNEKDTKRRWWRWGRADELSMAEKSYPTSEVRGSGLKCRLQWRRNAERSYPVSEVRGGGQEETPSIRGQGGRREELPCI